MQERVCGLKWFDGLIRVVQNYYKIFQNNSKQNSEDHLPTVLLG
jgi:hypothetical protein